MRKQIFVKLMNINYRKYCISDLIISNHNSVLILIAQLQTQSPVQTYAAESFVKEISFLSNFNVQITTLLIFLLAIQSLTRTQISCIQLPTIVRAALEFGHEALDNWDIGDEVWAALVEAQVIHSHARLRISCTLLPASARTGGDFVERIPRPVEFCRPNSNSRNSWVWTMEHRMKFGCRIVPGDGQVWSQISVEFGDLFKVYNSCQD